MDITSRRILLAVLVLIGGFVGGWAALLPATFYTAFPGFGLASWVADDGPYNEHLIRDVGELNLALAAAALVALLTRRAAVRVATSRVAAVAWLVYSVPHLTYHLVHLGALTGVDTVVEPIALSLSILASLALLLPDRGRRTPRDTPEGEPA